MKQNQLIGDITVFYPEVISTFNNDEILEDISSLLTQPSQKIILNLRNTRYIDSSGINLLLNSEKRAGKGRFRIAEARDKVKKLLLLSQLNKRMILYEDENQAALSFRAGSV